MQMSKAGGTIGREPNEMPPAPPWKSSNSITGAEKPVDRFPNRLGHDETDDDSRCGLPVEKRTRRKRINIVRGAGMDSDQDRQFLSTAGRRAFINLDQQRWIVRMREDSTLTSFVERTIKS